MNRRKLYTMELRCQEAFLKFMAITMKGYQNFLRAGLDDNTMSTPEAPSGFYNFNDLFDLNEFLKFHKSNKVFYSEFCNTHSFAHFIHSRSHLMNFSSSMADYTNNYVVFFDQCSEKDEDAHLLEVDKSLLVEHCKFISISDPKDPSKSYDYGGVFPKLDASLFEEDKSEEGSSVGGGARATQSSIAVSNHSLMATPVHAR